jgi:hypothetical protein
MITHLYACKAICSLKNNFFLVPSMLDLKFIRFSSMLLHFGNLNVRAKWEKLQPAGDNTWHLHSSTKGFYMKHVRFLPLPISVAPSSLFVVSIFTDCAFVFLTFAANIPVLLIVILQCIIISLIHCFRCTSLFKSLHSHFCGDVLSCHDAPLTKKRTLDFWILLVGVKAWSPVKSYSL